jgi:hypothetical protein
MVLSRARHVCCRFFSDKETVGNVFTGRYIIYFKGILSQGNRLLNLLNPVVFYLNVLHTAHCCY